MSFSYKIVSNFLSKEECKLLLNFSLENLKLNSAELVELDSFNKPNNNARKSNVAFYPYYKRFPFLHEKLSKVITDEINVKGFDLNYVDSSFQFTEYKDGDYFDWHKDVIGDAVTQKDRYCSIVIQLNDEYDGGDLEIKPTNDDMSIKVEKGIGNLIVLLSNMEHRVTTVTNGVRYTLVNWIGLKEKTNFKKSLL
jgi:PKHD-type hydroxylase